MFLQHSIPLSLGEGHTAFYVSTTGCWGEAYNVGKFTEVETKIKEQNYAVANTLLQGITPALTSEENYKLFYTYYQKYIDSTLTTQDSIAIDSLARQCPELGGIAVYKFETLRASVFGAFNSTVFHCELPNVQATQRVAHSATGINKNNKTKYNAITIAPNPSNGSFSIKGNYTTADNLTYEVYSIDGKLMYVDKLIFYEGISVLNLNLNNGIYTIKVLSNKENKIQKIVITN